MHERQHDSPQREVQNSKLPESFAIVLVLTTALLARLLVAALPNFQDDESFTYFFSRLPIPDILRGIQLDRHPPLYYLFYHALARATHSETLLRAPSIVCSLLSIFLIFKIARILFRDNGVALLAAWFSALFFSFWHIDVLARMFAPAQFLQLAATFFWLKIATENNPRRVFFFLYIITMTMSLATLYFSALIFVGHVASLILFNGRAKRLWEPLLAVTVLSLPIFCLIERQSHLGETFSLSQTMLYLTNFYPYFLGIVPSTQAAFHVPLAKPLSLIGSGLTSACLLGMLGIQLRKSFARNPKGAGFLSLLIVCELIPLVLGATLFQKFLLRERYFYLLYPYLVISLALGLKELRWKLLKNTLILFLIAMNLGLFVEYNFSPYLWIYDLKPFAVAVKEEGRPRDLVALYLPPESYLIFNFYAAPEKFKLRIAPDHRNGFEYGVTAPGPPSEYSIASLEELKPHLTDLRKFPRIWLVLNNRAIRYSVDGRPAHYDEQLPMMLTLEQYFNIREKLRVTTAYELSGDMTHLLYELTPRSGSR